MDLCLIAAAKTSGLADILSGAWAIASVALGLGFVIFVHELGHFLVAKACGVKCDKFNVGFDWFPIEKIGPFTIPTSLWKRQWGETEYGIGILPLGGYVKMLGQDDDPRNAVTEAERTKLKAEGASETSEEKFTLDPRSYPAKSVPARMAIISAGVIMNVIFGVLLGTLAYGLGVPEMPAIIGGTSPGSPAWEQLQPGMQAIQFASDSGPYEHHRFEDVKRHVVFTGDDADLKVLMRDRDGQTDWFTLRPSGRTKKETDFPSLGFYSASSRTIRTLADERPDLDANSTPAIKDRDIVVAIEDVALESDPKKFDYRVNAMLARNPTKPLKITVERKPEQENGQPSKADQDTPGQRIDIVVQPRGMRTVGLVMKIGPVVSIRHGSPAAQAGFRVGDRIESVNGQPVGDPLSLGQRLIPSAGKTTTYKFVVVRHDSAGKVTTDELTVTPTAPGQFSNDFPMGGPAAIESVGVAFDVTSEVVAVEPNSPAEKAGLKAGDQVTAVLVEPADKAAVKKNKKSLEFRLSESIVLDGELKCWTRIQDYMQSLLPDSKIAVTVKRADKELTVSLAPEQSATYFDERRGLHFAPLQIIHKANSVGEAFALGYREVKERMGEVLATLKRLVLGRISAKHLSGPAGILTQATVFASAGLPMLLIFLTMLSANLAIVNFLPIPVLDGGHMLFLAAEWIRRKPVPPAVQIWLSGAGLLFLLSLMVFATTMDIGRWLK